MTSIDLAHIDKNLIDWRAVIERVLTGEQINITQANVTVAQLSPKTPQNSEQILPKKRAVGFMKGQIQFPDDIHFGDDEIVAMFEASNRNSPL